MIEELTESRLNKIRLRFHILKLVWYVQDRINQPYVPLDSIYYEIYSYGSMSTKEFLEKFLDEMLSCGMQSLTISHKYRQDEKKYCPDCHLMINGDNPDSNYHIGFTKSTIIKYSIDDLVNSFHRRFVSRAKTIEYEKNDR